MKKAYLITAAILAIAIYGCNHNPAGKPHPAPDDFASAIPKDSGTAYYPLDSFCFEVDNDRRSDSFIKAIYSDMLFRLKEPVLYNYKAPSETVRFLWVRAFDNPVVVRVSNWEDSLYVTVKELGAEPAGDNDYVYRKTFDTSFTLASTNLNNVFDTAEVEATFHLPGYDTLLHTYKDATMWVLEYNGKGRYHCTDRLYVDRFSLEGYPMAQKMYGIGDLVTRMKSRKDQ